MTQMQALNTLLFNNFQCKLFSRCFVCGFYNTREIALAQGSALHELVNARLDRRLLRCEDAVQKLSIHFGPNAVSTGCDKEVTRY